MNRSPRDLLDLRAALGPALEWPLVADEAQCEADPGVLPLVAVTAADGIFKGPEMT